MIFERSLNCHRNVTLPIPNTNSIFRMNAFTLLLNKIEYILLVSFGHKYSLLKSTNSNQMFKTWLRILPITSRIQSSSQIINQVKGTDSYIVRHGSPIFCLSLATFALKMEKHSNKLRCESE